MFEKSSLDNEAQHVDLNTLIVPYLDIDEDGNPDTASLKWAIIGTYSLKDTEFIQEKMIDYQTNVAPFDNKSIAEFIQSAYKQDITIELISMSDKKGALSDLATWNNDVSTENEALQWLIERNYETYNYAQETEDLYNNFKENKQIPDDAWAEAEKHETTHEKLKLLIKKGYSYKKDIEKEHPQPKDKTKPIWDDEHWEDQDTVTLMRSAAVHKLNESQQYKKSTIKEIISDAPIAATFLFSVTATIVNHADSISTPSAILTALGGAIAYMINNSKNQVEKELDEILESLSNFRKNKDTPEKREQAATILKQDVARLNIKLSNIKPVTKTEFREKYPELLQHAKGKGYIPDPDLSTKKVLEASNSLLHIKNTKNIASNFAKKIKEGSIETWNALCESITEYKEPLALISGTGQGAKALYLNTIDWLHISDIKQKQETSKIAIERTEDVYTKIKGQDEKLPITEMLHSSVSMDDLEASKAAHTNIIEYKNRQPINLLNFGLASSLTGYAGYDLVSKSMSLAQTYYPTPEITQQAQEILHNALTDNWLGVVSNSWGILLGGIAALSATGHKYSSDTMALRSEFVKVDQNLSSILNLEGAIREIHKQQTQKAETTKEPEDMLTND